MHTLELRDDRAWILAAAGAGLAGALALTLSAYAVSPAVLPAAVGVAVVLWLAVRAPHVALACAFVALPLEALRVPVGIGALSPTEAVLVLVAVVTVARIALGDPSVARPSLRDAPLFALLVIMLVPIAWAHEPAFILRQAILWGALVCVYLQAQTLTRGQARVLIGGLVVGAAIAAVIGSIEYLGSDKAAVTSGGVQTQARALAGLGDANYFGAFLVLAVLPALALGIADIRRSAWMLPCAGAVLAGIAFSLSRGAMLGLAAGLLVLCASPTARRAALTLAVAGAVVVAAGGIEVRNDHIAAVGTRLSTIAQPVSSASANRPRIWATAQSVAAEHPLVGIGRGEFEFETARRGVYEAGQPLENAHNLFLSAAAETGVLGVGALLFFLAQVAMRSRAALRSRDVVRRALAVGALAALAAFVVQGLTVDLLRPTAVAAAFFVLAGTLTGIADRPER